MSVLVALHDRQRLQAVLVERYGTGWRVGIGALAAGTVEREATCHLIEKDAVRAAMALADAFDLIAVRA